MEGCSAAEDGTLDKAELKALVIGSSAFMKEKMTLDTAKSIKELRKTMNDQIASEKAWNPAWEPKVPVEPMIDGTVKIIETTMGEVTKNLDATIKNPDEAVASLAKALDADGDDKITKAEFLANGGEAIFAQPLEGLSRLADMQAGGMQPDCTIM